MSVLEQARAQELCKETMVPVGILHEHNAYYSRALLAFLTVYFDKEVCA